MLSKKTKYAINALVRLAKEYNNGPMFIKDIADKEKLPQKFLEAILRELKNEGYVHSKQGRNGGYYLASHPSEINLADIIRKFDGAIAFIPCVTYCYYEKCEFDKNEELCGIRPFFKEVRDKSVEIFKKASLEAIINEEFKLKI